MPGLNMSVFDVLANNGMFAFALLVLSLLLFWLRRVCCRRHDRTGITWDCGFAEPTARMQYTSSAFIQPLADLFNGILRQKKAIVKDSSLFHEKASIAVETPDGGSRWLWNPLFHGANYLSDRV